MNLLTAPIVPSTFAAIGMSIFDSPPYRDEVKAFISAVVDVTIWLTNNLTVGSFGVFPPEGSLDNANII
jgi:hypothetical protein